MGLETSPGLLKIFAVSAPGLEPFTSQELRQMGISLAASATLGDLTESTIKRDLGIKDMGSILPGHGGLMDRMDSLLLSAPVAWAILTILVPVAGRSLI